MLPAGLPNPDPTEIIDLGLGKVNHAIISSCFRWLFLVNSLSFSIHQINMYMSSTATPKPYPTSVQKAGPKIWTIFRQKWLKKTLPFWAAHTCFRVQPSKRTPNKHLALLTVCQLFTWPLMLGHFSLQ